MVWELLRSAGLCLWLSWWERCEQVWDGTPCLFEQGQHIYIYFLRKYNGKHTKKKKKQKMGPWCFYQLHGRGLVASLFLWKDNQWWILLSPKISFFPSFLFPKVCLLHRYISIIITHTCIHSKDLCSLYAFCYLNWEQMSHLLYSHIFFASFLILITGTQGTLSRMVYCNIWGARSCTQRNATATTRLPNCGVQSFIEYRYPTTQMTIWIMTFPQCISLLETNLMSLSRPAILNLLVW